MAVIVAERPCFFDLSCPLQTYYAGWCVVTKFADMIDSFFTFSKLTAKFLLLLNSHVWVINIPCQHNIAPLFRVAGSFRTNRCQLDAITTLTACLEAE